jgi:hypothetical protein
LDCDEIRAHTEAVYRPIYILGKLTASVENITAASMHAVLTQSFNGKTPIYRKPLIVDYIFENGEAGRSN